MDSIIQGDCETYVTGRVRMQFFNLVLETIRQLTVLHRAAVFQCARRSFARGDDGW